MVTVGRTPPAEFLNFKDRENKRSGAQEENPSHEQGEKKINLASHFSPATFNSRRQGSLVFIVVWKRENREYYTQ